MSETKKTKYSEVLHNTMEKDQLVRFIEDSISANSYPSSIKKIYQRIKTKDPDNTERLKNLYNKIQVENLKQKFKDYEFELNWHYEEKLNPDCEAVEVIVKTKDGKRHVSNYITTLKFINELFEKNKKTGECANGTYLYLPKWIIVEKITKENIKKTLDDLIETEEIEEFFDIE